MSDNPTSFSSSCRFRLFRTLIISGCLCVLMPALSLAVTFEDGKAAYQAKDYKTALAIIRPLAEQGNSQAQVTLGIMYDYGQGIEKNPAEAMKWYIKAAEQGIPVVQHDVGVKYFQGTGVKQNYLEAARWWEQSANAGLADSQFNLGLLYYRGMGLAQDYAKAAELFLKAADQGHANAQYSLAVMHAFGQGMEKNYPEALRWFEASAAQNVPQAQFNLGVFYENGYGVEKNPAQAREWFTKAAGQGLAEAKKKLEELSSTTEAPVEHPEPETLAASVPEVTSAPITATLAPSEPAPSVPETPVVSASAASDPEGIKREDWVKQQNPETYTLQLSSLLSEADALKFIKSNRLEAGAAYIKVVVNGTTRYTALYGVYTTHAEAESAVKQLPQSLQANKPWVRNFGVLQKMLQ